MTNRIRYIDLHSVPSFPLSIHSFFFPIPSFLFPISLYSTYLNPISDSTLFSPSSHHTMHNAFPCRLPDESKEGRDILNEMPTEAERSNVVEVVPKGLGRSVRLTNSLTCSLIHLHTYSLTHSLTHLLAHSLTNSLIHSLSHPLSVSVNLMRRPYRHLKTPISILYASHRHPFFFSLSLPLSSHSTMLNFLFFTTCTYCAVLYLQGMHITDILGRYPHQTISLRVPQNCGELFGTEHPVSFGFIPFFPFCNLLLSLLINLIVGIVLMISYWHSFQIFLKALSIFILTILPLPFFLLPSLSYTLPPSFLTSLPLPLSFTFLPSSPPSLPLFYFPSLYPSLPPSYPPSLLPSFPLPLPPSFLLFLSFTFRFFYLPSLFL